VSAKGRRVMTKSGTQYWLGQPASSYAAIREQLCRKALRGVAPVAFDPDDPLAGIDLGEVVPCAAVRIPRIEGWTPDSGNALLDRWTLTKLERGGFTCTGTVYNCASQYDGTEHHTTAVIDDVQGHVAHCVDNATYFLGRQAESDPAVRGEAEKILRSLADTLRV